MDEDQQEFVRAAYTFSAKLNEHADAPKYVSVSAISQRSKDEREAARAELSQWLVLFANVVHAFAEAAEVELGRDPDPAPPGRAQRKPPEASL